MEKLNSVYTTLGASNHTDEARAENDFYATNPKSLEILLDKLEIDEISLNKNIWECACGLGHLSNVLTNRGYNVKSTDLIERGFGVGGVNFLLQNSKFNGDILTNPPYKYAKDFVKKSLELINDGNYVIMLLKIQFLEGQDRRLFFENNPPKYVYVFFKRQQCYINGKIESYKNTSSAICYCWFIWQKGFNGEPVIRWL